jgi:hypothetical protein
LGSIGRELDDVTRNLGDEFEKFAGMRTTGFDPGQYGSRKFGGKNFFDDDFMIDSDDEFDVIEQPKFNLLTQEDDSKVRSY